MPLPTWVQGSRYSGITITIKRSDGTAYVFPIGAVVTGVLYVDATQTSTPITGTLTPAIGSNTVTYQPSSADVATPGQYTVQLTITTSGVPDTTFEEPWMVLPKR